jgi:hypothetical protein
MGKRLGGNRRSKYLANNIYWPNKTAHLYNKTKKERNVAHTHIPALWQRLIYFSRGHIDRLK